VSGQVGLNQVIGYHRRLARLAPRRDKHSRNQFLKRLGCEVVGGHPRFPEWLVATRRFIFLYAEGVNIIAQGRERSERTLGIGAANE
jgi:hypothetical protein